MSEKRRVIVELRYSAGRRSLAAASVSGAEGARFDSRVIPSLVDREGRRQVPEMKECGIDGTGVLVAVVDTGINIEYLNSKGKPPT